MAGSPPPPGSPMSSWANPPPAGTMAPNPALPLALALALAFARGLAFRLAFGGIAKTSFLLLQHQATYLKKHVSEDPQDCLVCFRERVEPQGKAADLFAEVATLADLHKSARVALALQAKVPDWAAAGRADRLSPSREHQQPGLGWQGLKQLNEP